LEQIFTLFFPQVNFLHFGFYLLANVPTFGVGRKGKTSRLGAIIILGIKPPNYSLLNWSGGFPPWTFSVQLLGIHPLVTFNGKEALDTTYIFRGLIIPGLKSV